MIFYGTGQKVLNRYLKQEEERKSCFLRKIYLSSFSWQSREVEFNKFNKPINTNQLNCGVTGSLLPKTMLIVGSDWSLQHHFLKSVIEAHNLTLQRECSSLFQDTAARKVYIAHQPRFQGLFSSYRLLRRAPQEAVRWETLGKRLIAHSSQPERVSDAIFPFVNK